MLSHRSSITLHVGSAFVAVRSESTIVIYDLSNVCRLPGRHGLPYLYCIQNIRSGGWHKQQSFFSATAANPIQWGSNATLEYVTGHVLLAFLNMEQNCLSIVMNFRAPVIIIDKPIVAVKPVPSSVTILKTCVFLEKKTTADIRTGSTFLA